VKHHRQVIREAVATLLSPISATIHRTRVYRLASLPAISVFVGSESITEENSSHLNTPKRYSRQAELQIDVSVEATSNVDDVVDDLVAQVEARLAADPTFTTEVPDSTLTRTSFESNGDGDTPYMTASILYRVWYRTTAADPENAL